MPLQTLQQFPVTQSGGVLGPVLSQLAPIVKNIKAKREGEEQQRRQQLAALALTARNQEDPQERRMVLLRALSSFPKDSEQVKQIIAATNERDPDKFNVELAKIAAFNAPEKIINDRLVGNRQVNQQFGGQILLKDDKGNMFFATTRKDPRSGQVAPVLSPLNHNEPVSGKLERVSGSGETPEERIENKVKTAEQIADIDVQKAVDTAQQTSGIEVETAGKKQQAETRVRTKEQRISEAIDIGVEAADAIPVVIRAIDILGTVETGGFDAAALRVKQITGTESADEAELSNNLGKAVLSQLRAIFGAAFTAAEGAKLERMEAGFGKSTEGNKRILRQLRQMLKKKAEDGIRAAEAQGDDFTADRIRRSMAFRLTTPKEGDDGLTAEEREELEALRKGQTQ